MVVVSGKRKFLVLYGYGMGGLWAYLRAESEDQIRREYPELKVIRECPPWMTEELQTHIEENMTFDIDAPTGWLAISEKRGSR